MRILMFKRYYETGRNCSKGKGKQRAGEKYKKGSEMIKEGPNENQAL